jgi:hypothetical protein
MNREQARVLSEAADQFVSTAGLILADVVAGERLDGGDGELIPRLVDRVIEDIRAELVEIIEAGIGVATA